MHHFEVNATPYEAGFRLILGTVPHEFLPHEALFSSSINVIHGTQLPPCNLGSALGSSGWLAGGTAVLFHASTLASNCFTISEMINEGKKVHIKVSYSEKKKINARKFNKKGNW